MLVSLSTSCVTCPYRDLEQRILGLSSFLDVSNKHNYRLRCHGILTVRNGDVDWKTLSNILVAQVLGDVCCDKLYTLVVYSSMKVHVLCFLRHCVFHT